MIGATIRNTANPTMLEAGYKANVIPSRAEATIDTRFLPGQEDALLATIDELLGEGVERESDRPRHRRRDRLRRRARRRDVGGAARPRTRARTRCPT